MKRSREHVNGFKGVLCVRNKSIPDLAHLCAFMREPVDTVRTAQGFEFELSGRVVSDYTTQWATALLARLAVLWLRYAHPCPPEDQQTSSA